MAVIDVMGAAGFASFESSLRRGLVAFQRFQEKATSSASTVRPFTGASGANATSFDIFTVSQSVGRNLPGVGYLTLHIAGGAAHIAFDDLEDGAVVMPDVQDAGGGLMRVKAQGHGLR